MRFATWSTLATLVLLTGCENAQLRERRARRDVNLARTFACLDKIEQRRPANRELAASWIEQSFAEDVEQTRRNKHTLRRWWEEFNRWEQNQAHRDARFSALLAGDPDNIERTWPRMIE